MTERQLSLNVGVMNLVAPFFGGMPMCHGASGFAGQYYFGARTGAANTIESLMEIGVAQGFLDRSKACSFGDVVGGGGVPHGVLHLRALRARQVQALVG